MQKRFQFFIALFFVASCTVSKNYKRPEVELPQQFANMAPSDTSVGDMNWRNFFGDTTLVRLIDQALAGSYDLQLAKKRIDEAAQYVKQAKMNYVPSVNAQASASTTSPSDNSLNGKSLQSFIGQDHLEDYTLAVGLSWELDVWGKIKRQKEAALANYLQTYEGARAVQTSLIANIANSYFNLLMLDTQLDITRKNLALSDTIVQMMRLQKQAGQVTELAVQQTEVQRHTAALLIPQLEQQIAIQENTIRILSGELPAPITRSAELVNIHMWDDLPTGVPAAMLSRRPDVRAREMALVAANANVGIAKAQMYPSFNITATGGLNAFKASKWFVMPASLFATAAGTVAQPILEHRQLKTNLRVAEVQREEAVLSFRQTALNATGEVVNALVQIDKLKSQRQIASAQVDTLHKAISNASLLFRAGMADYLEVVTAQSNSLNAELGLANIQRQQLTAMVELYRSLGGGWK
ncbi:MAG TPA: efflux transporter outer membrane subunit [Chitinophagaceae bacterium]|jgi:NodT family efflux transporter outer membrane factor (OMF) lipoprotein|nr:efflux transporter outer membrane subunit [Chitinophagaceae bacterium]